MGLRLIYHMVMGDTHYSKLDLVLEGSQTYRDVFKNADKINGLCNKVIYHAGKVMELSPNESEEHKHATNLSGEMSDLVARIQESRKFERWIGDFPRLIRHAWTS